MKKPYQPVLALKFLFIFIKLTYNFKKTQVNFEEPDLHRLSRAVTANLGFLASGPTIAKKPKFAVVNL